MQNKNVVRSLVGLGFLAMFLSSAFKGVFQVYFNDLALSFERGRSDFGFVGGVFLLVSGLASPMVGALSDRFGPIWTVLIGSVLGGGAFLLLGLLPHQYWLFVILYGLLAAFSLAAMTFVPMGILVDRLFDQRNKSFAYALITNGTAIGFIVLSPFWLWLQAHFEWQQVFFVVGLLFLGPLALLFWLGARVPLPAKESAGHIQEKRVGTWPVVLRDPGFYVLAFGFFGCGASMAFIDVHLVPLWRDAGVSRASMGMSLSLFGVLEMISGLAAGWLALRFSQHRLLASFYVLRCLAMSLLLAPSGIVTTYVFAAVFGASYLGTVILTSAICLDRYGGAVKGQVFGMLFLVHQIGAFGSAQLGAYGYDRLGSYQATVMVLAMLTAIAGISSLLLSSVAFRRTQSEFN